MRPWTIAVVAALLVAFLLPSGSAQTCEEGDPGCSPDSNDNAGENDQGPSEVGASPSAADQYKAEREQRKAQGWETARNAQGAGRAEEVRNARAQMPEETRRLVGNLVPDEEGFRGTYLDFATDPSLGILENVQRDGRPLFDSIYLPVGLGETARMETYGNLFRVSGGDWKFHLQDHATAGMYFRTGSADPFLLVLPPDAQVESMPYGVQVTYPAGGDAPLVGKLRGDVQTDAAEPGVLQITGSGVFHLDTERPLLPAVSNRVLSDLERAIQNGTLGGEVTVLRAAGSIFDDAVLYEDLDMVLEDETETAGVPTYTITIDSASHTGKTIAVAFQSGLIDADTLRFEYFNVDGDSATSAPIRQASHLQDVLDPLDDGTVAEFWIVEDEDGVQVLLSIPHFSVHQIRLSSLIELVIEQPSLVVGTIGAALLVGAATVGVFRRPEDDA